MVFNGQNADEINVIFDSIACCEQRIVVDSFEAGLIKGTSEGESDGYHFGFHRGVDVAAEIGYYAGIVETLRRLESERCIELTGKVRNVLCKIEPILSTFPSQNVDTDIQLLHKQETIMEDICATLEDTIAYLAPFLRLANTHTVDFIVGDSWSNVIPTDIRGEADTNGVDRTLSSFWSRANCDSPLLRFANDAERFVVERASLFCDFIDLNTDEMEVKPTECMSGKKLHEIERMSRLVASISRMSDAELVVDIGSGKGYLSAVLAIHHKLDVLGVDCSESNVRNAAKNTTILEKKWPSYVRKCGQADKQTKIASLKGKEPCASNAEYREKYGWKSRVINDSYKQRVQNVTCLTDLDEIVGANSTKLALVGLHTCGNLAATALRLFARNEERATVTAIVGCCYHLLDERNDCAASEYSFPMCQHLQRKNFALGRDARMCGTQKPQQTFAGQDLTTATKPLFYRALLQELFKQKCSADGFPTGVTGRMAHKCNSFAEYASKAMKKLNVGFQSSEDELNEFEKSHTSDWDHIKIFFLLKTALSPVIESVILLDRLLYLHEQRVASFVVRIFDPLISPRCYAIVGARDNVIIDKLLKKVKK